MSDAVGGKTSLRRQYKLVRRASAALVRVLGWVCILLGLMVLLGWLLDIRQLRSVVDGAVEMKANTAVAFVLAGAALVLFAARRQSEGIERRRSAQGLGLAAAAIGLATGSEYLFGWNLGIDEALVRDVGSAYNKAKGRMSPYSALAFSAEGIALALLPYPRLQKLTKAGACISLLVGLVSLVGYVWGARELMTDEWVPPVAVHTAVGFLSLGLATLVATYKFETRRGNLLFLLDPVERKIMASFAGALVLLVAMGGWTYRTAAGYALHSRELVVFKAFRSRLAEFQADVADAAFAQRTYLITGDAAGLERWRHAERQLATSRRLLNDIAHRAGLRDDSGFPAVDRAVGQLTTVLHHGVELYHTQGPDAARRFVLTGACTDAMAAVRAALVSVDTFEGAEEEDRETEVRQSQRRTLQITLLALITAAAMLGAVFLAIRREMLARVTAERGLRRGTSAALSANRFLESLIQNIPHMIFVKDARDLRFVRVNRAGERITGVRHEDFVGKSDRDFFPPQEAEFFISKDREVLARGTILDIPAEEIHGAGGQVRVLHTKKIPLYDAEGRPTHLLGISEDVTDVREKERQIRALNEALSERAEEVERVNRARSTFLATMSHEIRTPMNGMLGMLELLSLSPLNEKQRKTLYVVSESAQSLLRIIDDILDFSKIEAGRLELREEVASVAAIVGEVRNIHAPVASSKGLVITVKLDPALAPAAWLDPLRLRQVLNNLVSNAVKFTSHGHVAIEAAVLDLRDGVQTLRLTVTDTGTGVSAEDQDRLFEPFVQAAAGSNTASGTGLGLVISRRLAQLMGGTLEMASTPGVGTTMTLVIPVRLASAELLPPPAAQRIAELRDATELRRPPLPVAHAAEEGTLVLLVDDHPINRALLEQQLNTLGYAVQAEVDGAAALERWRSGRFGLVLTDCQMPGMSGYELARRIRQLEAETGRARTPIIACTAMALPEERDRCLEAGMDDVLFKPVQLRQMMGRLNHWLPLPQQAGADAQPDETRPPLPAGPGVVDIAFLEAAWGTDPKNIQAIVEAYARSVREDSAALREALARRDLDAVTQVAHRMLGASKMVGAYGLSESCELVNAAGRERNWEALAVAMDAFEAEYLRLMDGLAAA